MLELLERSQPSGLKHDLVLALPILKSVAKLLLDRRAGLLESLVRIKPPHLRSAAASYLGCHGCTRRIFLALCCGAAGALHLLQLGYLLVHDSLKTFLADLAEELQTLAGGFIAWWKHFQACEVSP